MENSCLNENSAQVTGAAACDHNDGLSLTAEVPLGRIWHMPRATVLRHGETINMEEQWQITRDPIHPKPTSFLAPCISLCTSWIPLAEPQEEIWLNSNVTFTLSLTECLGYVCTKRSLSSITKNTNVALTPFIINSSASFKHVKLTPRETAVIVQKFSILTPSHSNSFILLLWQ